MTKQEWLQRCAARYVSKAGVTQEQADEFALACFDDNHFLSTIIDMDCEDVNCPKRCADEDMGKWVRST